MEQERDHLSCTLGSWQRTLATVTSIYPSSKEKRKPVIVPEAFGQKPIGPWENPRRRKQGLSVPMRTAGTILLALTVRPAWGCAHHSANDLFLGVFLSLFLQALTLIPFESNQKTTIWYPFESLSPAIYYSQWLGQGWLYTGSA